MLASIYTFSFATCLGSLIAWFYYQEDPKFGRWSARVFVVAFISYLTSLISANGLFADKLFLLFRDFMVLSIIALFFNVIKKHLYVFVAGLVLLYGGFKFGYAKVMKSSLASLTALQIEGDLDIKFDQPIDAPQKKKQTDPIQSDGIALAMDGELLVELAEGGSVIDLGAELFMLGLNPTKDVRKAFSMDDEDDTTLDNFYIVNVQTAHELKSAKEQFAKSPNLVTYFEENEAIQIDLPSMEASATSRDTDEFLANDPQLNQSWSFQKLDVNQLHKDIRDKKIRPKKKALIAILDTGVDASHEDLKDKFKSIDKKHNDDPVNHGTHCAGIAAAVSNNGKGIASYAPNNDFVEVTSIKVLNQFGGGTQGTIINGILKAADAGADVISMSLGGRSNPTRQRAYNKAVAYANKKGAIVVVAAGNSNMNTKNYSPANAKGVIAVSATDIDKNRAVFSNKVNDVGMGIAAPGVNIYSTIPGNEYKAFNGTSMAAPHVAGLVGMMKAIFPEMTTKDAFHILEKTGTPTNDVANTGKLIQPVKAIAYLTQPD